MAGAKPTDRETQVILRYTILYVENVAAALDFYEKAFGLERLFLHESGDYGELATGETKLAFSSKALMNQLGKTPGTPEPKAPVFELAFETDDVAASLARAVAAGANKLQDAREEPWGQITSYVSDPFGYLVEICSPIQLPSAG
jgi:lactoylglutathione lyase|nr:VOC family protein [Labrenzia sp. R5_0]